VEISGGGYASVGQQVTFTAKGKPKPGNMAWSGGDEIVSRTQSSYVVKFSHPGLHTVSATWTCESGESDTKSASVKIMTKRITVIAWINAQDIHLPEGANPNLVHDLQNIVLRAALLESWRQGREEYLLTPTDRLYASIWLLQHSGNNRPPDNIGDGKQVLLNGDYRLFVQAQPYFNTNNGLISGQPEYQSPPVAVVGSTPLPLFTDPALAALMGVDAQANPLNGTQNNNSHQVALVAEGRLGETGQTINMTLNHTTVPWIWANIAFNPDGSYRVDHQIFPTYYIYEDGILKNVIPQASDVSQFINLGEESHFVPQ
jgi:PKD repeat protein